MQKRAIFSLFLMISTTLRAVMICHYSVMDKKSRIKMIRLFWCGWRDLNPHVSQHWNLKPARLPFRHIRLLNLRPLFLHGEDSETVLTLSVALSAYSVKCNESYSCHNILSQSAWFVKALLKKSAILRMIWNAGLKRLTDTAPDGIAGLLSAFFIYVGVLCAPVKFF